MVLVPPDHPKSHYVYLLLSNPSKPKTTSMYFVKEYAVVFELSSQSLILTCDIFIDIACQIYVGPELLQIMLLK